MSSHIVDRETISNVVSYFYSQIFGSDRDGWGHYFQVNGFALDNQKACEWLGIEMMNFNIQAFYCRYPSENEGSAVISFTVGPPVTAMQAFVSLQCWLYQCCECDFPTKPLYMFMDGLLGQLAISMAVSSPQYKTAKWG